jgi:hypothetical protein
MEDKQVPCAWRMSYSQQASIVLEWSLVYLVILYINDIAENLISLSRLFAVDTSFSYSSHDELQIQTVIDHCEYDILHAQGTCLSSMAWNS